MQQKAFQELIWEKGRELYRAMPWRTDTRGYYVLVSELMLQQTQVDRVIPKFVAFIAKFPDEQVLARASLAEVLTLWNGLGYNRRAKFLHEATKMIVNEYDGRFPDTFEELVKLPGVGKNTAGAILAYTFNRPVVFIETNVRTVYFEYFFNGDTLVDDGELAVIVGQTLDREHPREFYWALMDYGSWLKKQGAGQLTKSRHYKKQSPLKGSVREVRGQIIKLLTEKNWPVFELENAFAGDERYDRALEGLLSDGLVERTDGAFHLTK